VVAPITRWGVSASAWRTTGHHRQLVRRVDPVGLWRSAMPDPTPVTLPLVPSRRSGTWGAFERRVSECLRSAQGLKSPAEGNVRRMRWERATPPNPREINTRANPAFPRRSGLGTVITSAVATLIALGILMGTTMLFQSRGMPMAELAAAERACAGRPTSQIANAACANGWPRHTALGPPNDDRLTSCRCSRPPPVQHASVCARALMYPRISRGRPVIH